MTVGQLVKFLEGFSPSLPVAFCQYSEYRLMEPTDIFLLEAHPARADGWIHIYPRERSAETVQYLLFPGN